MHEQPYKGLCAKVLLVQMEGAEPLSDHSVMDEVIVSSLQNLSHPGQLHPLPVMGVPGWFAVNEKPDFYSDTSVFRPKPTRLNEKV
ncbi:MAG: DUF3025 domain-containing protein, partial [Limnobacter sp.]|nr:DUF3025 domain-containing protein [Limnobacter sp.]